MPLLVFSHTTTSRGQCACAARSLAKSCSDPAVTGALAAVWCLDALAPAGASTSATPRIADTSERLVSLIAPPSCRQARHLAPAPVPPPQTQTWDEVRVG